MGVCSSPGSDSAGIRYSSGHPWLVDAIEILGVAKLRPGCRRTPGLMAGVSAKQVPVINATSASIASRKGRVSLSFSSVSPWPYGPRLSTTRGGNGLRYGQTCVDPRPSSQVIPVVTADRVAVRGAAGVANGVRGVLLKASIGFGKKKSRLRASSFAKRRLCRNPFFQSSSLSDATPRTWLTVIVVRQRHK